MALEYTEEKLNSLDKETIIQLFLAQQEQLRQIDQNLQLVLEQLADQKRRRFGRSSEKHETEGQIAFMEKENENVLAYRRILGEEELIVFNNLTGQTTEVCLEDSWKNYRILLTNYEGEESGTEQNLKNVSDDRWTLRPFETLVLEK